MNTLFQVKVWIALYTISVKEIRRVIRIWPQTLLPSVITTVLYFVIFGSIMGKRIGNMAGFDYTTFVIPGLVMMGLITNCYTNVASSFYGNKFNHSIEEVLVSPVPDWALLLGYVMGGVVRGLIVAVLVMIVSMVFTPLHIHSWFATISAMLLTAFIFALAGFLNGLYAKKFDDVGIIPVFVLTPLTYLGGVFYSISVLPHTWKLVSYFNPILYEVSAFRYGLLGHSEVVHIIYTYLFMAVIVVLLFLISVYLLRKGKGIRT